MSFKHLDNVISKAGSGGIGTLFSDKKSNGKISQTEVDTALEDKENGVSELMGMISRKEWDDFKERYLPRIKDQADRITSGQNVKDAVDDARTSTENSFQIARQNLDLNNKRMGLSLTDRQQNFQNSQLGLSEVAAKVNNVNDARVSARDRDTALLSSGFASSMKTETGA